MRSFFFTAASIALGKMSKEESMRKFTVMYVLLVTMKPGGKTITPWPSRSRRAYGTGNLEIRIRLDGDFEKAKPLIIQSYETS